jgi:hypothetical protein
MNNFYKFVIGKSQIESGRVKSGENFTTNIRPARCEICTELLVASVCAGGNYTPRAGMQRMCDRCFKQINDKATGG